jgi:hypothetical protein
MRQNESFPAHLGSEAEACGTSTTCRHLPPLSRDLPDQRPGLRHRPGLPDLDVPRAVVATGIATLADMMERDARTFAAPATAERTAAAVFAGDTRQASSVSKGREIVIERPRVRARDGHELAMPSWQAAQAEDWLAR